MIQSSAMLSPLELAGAALTLPIVSMVCLTIAALVVAGAFLIRRLRPLPRRSASLSESTQRSVATRYRPEQRALGIAAIAVIVVVLAESGSRYLFHFADVVSWWRYATPLLAAAIGLAVVLSLVLSRGTTPPEQPVLPAARRTWTSFGPRAGLIGAGVAVVLLLVTTLAAGLASSADERGRFIYLAIPIPNESIDPIRPWFYGWAYGVPVLICLVPLVAVTWAVLRSNAMRPFLRPEAVDAERAARARIARASVYVATAGILLALAGAWRFIAAAATFSGLTIQDGNVSQSYEVIWRYAEFAVAAGWLAPIVEITAFVLLLLVASTSFRAGAGSRSVSSTERMPSAQGAR